MVKTPISADWIEKIESNENIYIAIPSFNETFLLETIHSIYTQASNPERVYVGICNQRVDGDFEDFSQFPNVCSLNIHYPFARGLGLAMLEAMMMWSGQKYFMRIDGHSIMNKSWDLKLVDAYQKLLGISDKPIISQRTDWFCIDENNNKIFVDGHVDPKYTDEELINVIRNSTLASFPEPIAWDESKAFVEHNLISGHFIFSDWRFFDELLADPRIVFFGEEHIYGIRAVTKGFRIFAIRERILHTLGKSETFKDGQTGSADWRNFIPNGQNSFLHFYYAYKNILSGLENGYYSVPSEDAYERYISKIGFSYRDFYDKNGFMDGL